MKATICSHFDLLLQFHARRSSRPRPCASRLRRPESRHVLTMLAGERPRSEDLVGKADEKDSGYTSLSGFVSSLNLG